jgi:hypothetical protein
MSYLQTTQVICKYCNKSFSTKFHKSKDGTYTKTVKYCSNPCRKNDSSRVMAEKVASGTMHISRKNFRHGSYVSQLSGKIEYFDSSYELIAMMLLDIRSDVVSWTKKHQIRVMYKLGEKTKTYIPDFYIKTIDGKTRIEEVKGRRDEIVIAKENALIEMCNNESWEYAYTD